MTQNSETRSGQERRNEERIRVAADIEWAAGGDIIPARLGDLSSSGCFVLTPGEFSDGEVVRLFFPSQDGAKTEILAEIRNYVEDIGFAARFVSLTESQRDFIRSFAEAHEMADTET